MRGAQPFRLHHHRVRRSHLLQLRHVGTSNDHDVVEHLSRCGQEVQQHGAARDGMQCLGKAGAHARSKSGGKNDGSVAHAFR
jgi:hypothetical protein